MLAALVPPASARAEPALYALVGSTLHRWSSTADLVRAAPGAAGRDLHCLVPDHTLAGGRHRRAVAAAVAAGEP
jgi:hypothetical protein